MVFAAHEFSTTAGGRCPEGGSGRLTSLSPDNPFSDICTWSPVATESWVSADAGCLEDAILTAVEAEAAECLTAGQCADARGGGCWLSCVTANGGGPIAAGERALAQAFATGMCTTATEDGLDRRQGEPGDGGRKL